MHSGRVRVDPALVLASAAVLGGLVAASPVAVGCASVALAAVLAPRLSPRVLVGVVLVLALSGVRAARAVAAYETELLRVRAALAGPRRCSGIARVESVTTVRAGSPSTTVRFESLECESRDVGRALVRLYGGPEDVRRGDRVEVVAQLATTELFRNAELPDPTPPAARLGVTASGGVLSLDVLSRGASLAALIDRARVAVRARIEATFVPLAAPLARALVLGENDLTDEDGAAFRASGLSHLLAVSGTHLVFAVLGIVRALEFVFARVERFAAGRDVGRLAALTGAVLAPIYADFAGGSGSAWRAAWMLSVGLGARAVGRRPSTSRAFALSLVTGVVLDPLIGFDVSFLLSAGATAGLIGIGQPLAERFVPEEAPGIVKAVVGSLVATVSAMVPCAPLLAVLGPSLTVAGIVANVLAVPFGEIISLPLCLVHAVVPFAPSLEHGIGLVASGALLVVRALAKGSAAATFLAVPVPAPTAFHFVVLVVGGLGAATAGATRWEATAPAPVATRRRRLWGLATAIAVLVVELATRRAGAPRGELRVTVLDVGQGDSALVDLPDGALVLVDGGGFVGSPVNPGVSVVAPVLRRRRRAHVDVAVLSHPHPDHYLGLATALATVSVGELWDTGQGEEQGAGPEYHDMLRDLRARRVPVLGPRTLCAGPRPFHGALLRMLSPCPGFDPVLGPNDNSFVFRLEYGSRAVLFTGDAEHEAEARLVRDHGAELSADLLKAGHHGSRTSSSPALLERVRPEVATVSCGVRNRFGHPHPLALAALAHAGVFALRTDLVGSVEWRSDGDAVSLRVFGGSFDERRRASLW